MTLFVGTIHFSYADEDNNSKRTIEQKCENLEAKLKPNESLPSDCQLLNLLNAEVQERIAGDGVLEFNANEKFGILSGSMEQDASVCDTIDPDRISKDTTLDKLCKTANTWVANYEAICNNVPLFSDAIGIVDISVIAVLGASNTALGGVNTAFNSLRNFNFAVNINPPGFNLNIPDIKVKIPIPLVPDPEINIPLPNININVPSFGASFGKLLGFLPASPIPLIPGNVIGNVDVKLDQVADCSII